MILVGTHQISKSFTARPLFQGISFSIESGERIGLIGPNGAGKSTLLRILANKISPDEGKLSSQKGLRLAFLEQIPQFSKGASLQSSVFEGAEDIHDPQNISKAHELIARLDLNRWDLETPIDHLSGGWKKRVALARELLREPDLFLLDEPTNHLDVDSILWLEDLLARSAFASIVITHDRLFLQRVSNRIVELNRRYSNGLLSVNGDYGTFLTVRDELLMAQELHETKLKNTLRREKEWLGRGAQARQTKQQARIQSAKELEEKVDDLSDRNQKMKVRLDFQSTQKKPKKLIEAKGISKSYEGRCVIPKMDLLISSKSRIGLMGVNGCGKSTLIKLLSKEEESDSGSVFHSDELKISYYEQNRESLDPKASLLKTICPYGDHVNFAGDSIHIRSYLARFLFSYEQMDLSVEKLSGGEQSRLLLARLMLQPANILVLDEPTNDLDIATLDILLDVLQEFNGAIILVSHDRYFLDQLSHQIFAFGVDQKGNKEITSMVGLDQWEEWHAGQLKIMNQLKTKEVGTSTNSSLQENQVEIRPPQVFKKRKLSYKEIRELDSMEDLIHQTEENLQNLLKESAQAETISNSKRLNEIFQEVANLEKKISHLYDRWSELSELSEK